MDTKTKNEEQAPTSAPSALPYGKTLRIVPLTRNAMRKMYEPMNLESRALEIKAMPVDGGGHPLDTIAARFERIRVADLLLMDITRDTYALSLEPNALEAGWLEESTAAISGFIDHVLPIIREDLSAMKAWTEAQVLHSCSEGALTRIEIVDGPVSDEDQAQELSIGKVVQRAIIQSVAGSRVATSNGFMSDEVPETSEHHGRQS